MTDFGLRQWLEQAVEAYGADLPLRGLSRAQVDAWARAAAPPASGPSAALSAGAPSATPGAARPAPSTPPPRAPTARPAPPASAARRPAERRPAAPAAAAKAAQDAARSLAELRDQLTDCRRCKLCEKRTQVVFGEGDANAAVMFIGEAPGRQEDRQGRPFVGPAGQLLDRIIEGGMGLGREDVYIANVNKCRPPENRDPQPDEVAACLPFLRQQVALLQPRVIVALGRVAAHNLLGTTQSMSRLRGRDLEYEGIPVVATWHPAYLLRTPAAKADTWQDVKRVNRMLGKPEDPRSDQG
ncbi:MAG: uracil-DNA glycosylase [Planctomycetota bacterium]